jgi:formate hydrogenlyase subunit 6/NADH:ubiquinone oxidoreductase subunit I
MLELLKKIAIFKYVMTDRCNQCNVCQKACPVETRPSEINCTNCGDCKDSCPIDAISVRKGL